MLNIIIVAIFFYKFSQNFASKNRFSQNYQVWLKINLIRSVSHPATRHWWELRAVHPTVANQNQHLKDTSYMRAGTWRHVIYRTWVLAMSANWTMLQAAHEAPSSHSLDDCSFDTACPPKTLRGKTMVATLLCYVVPLFFLYNSSNFINGHHYK